MKPLPPALRNGLLRMRRENASFSTIAKAFGVPVGTVKSVCSKEGVRKVMEPPVAKGKEYSMEPAKKEGRREKEGALYYGSVSYRMLPRLERREAAEVLHRGLRLADMPGRTGWERRSTFALFKRGEWPPLHWSIPSKLEGAELREILMERAVMYRPKGKGVDHG